MDLTLLFMCRINVAKTVRYLSISVIMLCPLFTLVNAILDLVTKAEWTQRRDSFCDCICIDMTTFSLHGMIAST